MITYLLLSYLFWAVVVAFFSSCLNREFITYLRNKRSAQLEEYARKIEESKSPIAPDEKKKATTTMYLNAIILKHSPEAAFWLGVLEIFAYILAIRMGFSEFIGVWIVAKSIGNWSGSMKDSKGRGDVTIFLFGTLFSVTVAGLFVLFSRHFLTTSIY